MSDSFGISRRILLQTSGSAMGLLAVSRAHASMSLRTGRKVVDLRVDAVNDPMGVDSDRPRLSWRTETVDPQSHQTAYRILVASVAERLAAGEPDIWDSGRVESANSLDVAYEGPPLQSRQRAHWQVVTWDGRGEQTTSDPASWETGLIDRADWKGDWLAAESTEIAGDRAAGLHWVWSSYHKTEETQLFRYRIELDAAPEEAVLQVVARDSLDGVWLDGRPVERTLFRPGVVNNARMETVAVPLHHGTNVLTVAATYHPERGPVSPSGGMAAVLRVRYADGRVERYTTEQGWDVATASSPSSGDAQWRPAIVAISKPRFDPWPAGPAMLLRRQFTVRGKVARARLYATALGGYYAHLNGARVSDAMLTPESTDFSKRVLYRIFDVTPQMRIGSNMLGAIVGDGWYGSTGLFGGRYDFGPAPCRFIAQLEIDYVDGSRDVIATGSDWETTPSPILSSEIYDGEVYDARQERDGWDEPDGSRDGWRQATIAPPTSARLVAQIDAPIRITRTLKPVAIRKLAPGKHVVDFGQNFAGWCRLMAQAPAGRTITMRFAEILKSSGEVDQSNLRSAMARDRYTFRGNGVERYRPHFTYHGFRYVQIEGWEGDLPEDIVFGEVIHSDLGGTGTFTISDPLVQKLWQNTLWSQRSNFVGIPTDCPQRDERLGWMGDAQVFWDAATFNMDVDAFTRRFMGDVRDAQAPSGAFAEYNPQSEHANMKGAPGWADAGILLPWTVWWRYGDTGIVDENWSAMADYAEHVFSENRDLIWRNARGTDYGDWLALDAKQPGDPTTPKDLVATAMWAHVTDKLAQMAQATGRTEAAKIYRKRRDGIGAAFAREFIRADGSIGNGSQTGYILALRYGIVPDNVRRAAGDKLVADIRRRGTLLSTGFLGTPNALDVLLDLGEREIVYALLQRTEFPSWGYMVAKGATTIWERWNGDVGDVSMNSYNHYALGAVIGFLYRRIAGIDTAEPGFRAIRLAPETRLGFASAAADFDSPMGRVATRWQRTPELLSLRASVPPNTTASLTLPMLANERVTIAAEQGREVPQSVRDDTVTLDLAPGDYFVRIAKL